MNKPYKKRYMFELLSPFMRACADGSVDAIKNLLINDANINMNEFTDARYTGLHLACRYNKNPGVIHYLIDDLKFSLNETTNDHETIFTLACVKQPLDVIKYIVLKIYDCKKTNAFAFIHAEPNALYRACPKNTLDVVKYLIDELSFEYDRYVLLSACRKSKYVDVVKYLATKLNINDADGEYIIATCKYNSSSDILRYLLEDLKIKCRIDDILNACYNNKCDDIIKYLAYKPKILLHIVNFYFTTEINNFIKKLHRIKHPATRLFIDRSSTDVKDNYIVNYDSAYNYLLEAYPELLKHKPFSQIQSHIDELSYATLKKLLLNKQIEQEYHVVTKLRENLFKSPLCDVIEFHKKVVDEYNEPVFSCVFVDDPNVHMYYCSKWWLYRVIPALKKADGFGGLEKNNGICLNITQSKKVFDKYINTCCTGKIDLSEFDVSDAIQLLYLMDMYHNVMFEPATLEMLIVSLMKDADIDNMDQDTITDITLICDKFQFKHLLMTLHCKCTYYED